MATITQMQFVGGAINKIASYTIPTAGDIEHIGGGRFLITVNTRIDLYKFDGSAFTFVSTLIDLGLVVNRIFKGVSWDGKNILALFEITLGPGLGHYLRIYSMKGDLLQDSSNLGTDARRGLTYDGKYAYTIEQSGSPDRLEKYGFGSDQDWHLISNRRFSTGNGMEAVTNDGKYFYAIQNNRRETIRKYMGSSLQQITSSNTNLSTSPEGLCYDGKYLYVVD
jgi:hypothetical protein